MKKLAHLTDDFTLSIDNKTPEQIIEEIHLSGYALGRTSLNMLLAGTCYQAGCFEMIDAKYRTKDKGVIVSGSDVRMQPAKKEHKLTALKTAKTKAEKKEHKVINPDSVLRGTKNEILFSLMTRPDGVTKEDIMKECDWNQSCFAAILYTVPKSKGYAVVTEKDPATHVLSYHLYFDNGAGKVLPEQLQIRERKVAGEKILSRGSTMSSSSYKQMNAHASASV